MAPSEDYDPRIVRQQHQQYIDDYDLRRNQFQADAAEDNSRDSGKRSCYILHQQKHPQLQQQNSHFLRLYRTEDWKYQEVVEDPGGYMLKAQLDGGKGNFLANKWQNS